MLTIVNYNKDEYNYPALIVLGCFDAIHIGHEELLKKAKLQAKINGLDLGVMMFTNGKGGKSLYTFEERCAFLEKYNVKFVLSIDFTEEFKKTTAAQFLENLEKYINVKGYMSGKDFRFGAGAKGKSSTLKKYADDEDNAIWYTPVKDVMSEGEKVSTTLIKQCLEQGAISRATQLLGRAYSVTGTVCDGHERGMQMGIPTANIAYPESKAHIKQGVYGVEISFDGNTYKGVANFGARPTFNEDAPVLEAYIIDYEGDLYGKQITVSFINYIRSIRKFDSTEALVAQIKQDLTHIGEPDSTAEDEPLDVDSITEAIAAPAEETVEEPVPEFPAEEVVAEEIAPEEPAIEEATEEPVIEEVTEEPVIEEVTEEPVTEEVTEEPAIEEAAEEPVTEEVTKEPVIEEAAEEPVTEEATEEPVTEEATEEPVIEEVAEEPVTEEVAEEPVIEEVTEEPAIEEAAEEPVLEEVAEKTAEEPVPEIPTEEVVAEEIAPDESVTEEAAEDPVTEEAAEEASEEPAPEISAEHEKELTPEELAELEFEREFALLLEEEEKAKAEEAKKNGGNND